MSDIELYENKNAKDTISVMGKNSQLRHLVLFKFKDESTEDQVSVIEKEFAKLPEKIETIIGYEWGLNISKENKDQGFTHCFMVTFSDQKGLDVYGPHPAHQAFVERLLPILDKVLVVDFMSES